MTKVVCRTDRSVTISSFSLLIWILGEVVAKFVEVMLPTRSPLGDPLLGCAQHDRLDTAGAHPPNLLRSDEAARLQHPNGLNDSWKRQRKWLGGFRDRRRGPTQPAPEEPPGRGFP